MGPMAAWSCDVPGALASWARTTVAYIGGGVALVFSDVLMPGTRNGLALAQDIRRIAPEVPVLLTTGYNDEMALQGPQPEALDVLGKPYRRTELIARVQAAIRRGGRNKRSHQTSDFGHAQG